MHLQAVLTIVGLREHEHRAKPMGDAHALLVQGHDPKWGGEGRRPREGEPVDGERVARSQHNDPLDGGPSSCHLRIGGGCGGAGVGIARVWRDYGFR